ncbi:MAG: NADH-quinone oxidoreductase subunit A [Proteobacteria bacterium]|nr:NADH-quinone oxidoreductase subunit A [Pseudomonadota bacterium]MBU1648747.1 NADH-quinone oxidoreductase subunit A [Pseudomonadota bacterium]
MSGSYLPAEYLAILLFMVLAVAFGMVTLWIGSFFRMKRPYFEKLAAYESGNPPTEEPRMRFSVKFYLIAILFIVFDVEAVYLYSWALVYDTLGLFAFIEMFIFISLLLVGYVYGWKKGALQWEK